MPLKLLRLLPSRRTKNRVWLLFDNSAKFPFYLDDAIALHLSSGLEISPPLFSKIQQQSLYYLLYNYSLNQVALSPKIAKILTPKINQKARYYQKKYQISGEFTDLTSQIITKLDTLGLLDPQSFAAHLLRKNQHRSRQYLSRLFAYYDLSLPPDFVSQDLDSIRKILSQKKWSSQNLSEGAVKNKLLASLSRKGFAYDDIKTAIDEFQKNS